MSAASYSPREMIERLVAFNTVSEHSNMALINWVADYLDSHGIANRKIFSPEGDKANLFATIGPEIEGGVVLSGHSDVVPVKGQAWDSDPFTLVEKDGKLFGRGTADMKSFLAIALALAPEFKALKPKKPIHIALSYDEEVGCTGVGHMIKDIVDNLPLPRAAIVGEPSDMKCISAHKGITAFRTTIRGVAAHSSQPHRGANANIAAGRLIEFIFQMAEQARHARSDPSSGFEPPYTSFQVGIIKGGVANNIIPQDCFFEWEFRNAPWDDPAALIATFERYSQDTVLPWLREFAPQAGIETVTLGSVPPLKPEEEGYAENLVRRITGANRSSVVSYATESGLFQEVGLSTVVCGPGSIDQAHQPNEFITVSQVDACAEFLRKLATWAANSSD
jgi:acetylornithine deacetylase